MPQTEATTQTQETLQEISTHFPGSFLHTVYVEKTKTQEKEKLLEAQLRWEKQVEELNNEKKQQMILQFVKGQVHKMTRVLMKSKTLAHEEKNRILTMMKAFSK